MAKFGGGKFGGVSVANKCGVCGTTVYPNDPQITVDGKKYLKSCFKCAEPRCGKQLTISNYATSGNELLCKTHFMERFRREGQYAGGEQYTKQTSAACEKFRVSASATRNRICRSVNI